MRRILSLLTIVLCGVCFRAALNAATFQVQIRDYFFTPTNLTIAVGDTIQWTNASGMQHDSTSTNAARLWNSGTLNAGATFAQTFTNPGTFSYLCSRHYFAFMNPRREQTGTVTVASADLPPEVKINTPTNAARFRAPASFIFQVNASDPGGSVTNVQFFSGGNLLGSAANPPHQIAVNSLPAGNHTLTARAQDNGGLATTSAPITIAVLTNAILTDPQRLPNGQFRLSIQTIADQSYTVEASTNLVNWSALATNVAPANTFNFTDSTAAGVLQKFYRARQELQ